MFFDLKKKKSGYCPLNHLYYIALSQMGHIHKNGLIFESQHPEAEFVILIKL